MSSPTPRVPDTPTPWRQNRIAPALASSKVAETGIVRGRAAGPSRHAERCELRSETSVRRIQLGICRIGARIAAFNVINAEIIEHGGDRQLVREREIDAIGLRAVAQSRVEQIQTFA